MRAWHGLSEDQLELSAILRHYLERRRPLDGLTTRDLTKMDEVYADFCDRFDPVGLAISESLGGSGGGLPEVLALFRELGRSLYEGPILSSTLAAHLLTTIDAPPATLLSELLCGASVGCVIGIDWSNSPSLGGERVGQEWILTGRASHIPHGAVAQIILVIADAGDGLGLFLVEESAAVGTTPLPSLDQTRPLANLDFDRTPVRLLSKGDRAATAMSRVRDVAVVAIISEQVGLAELCLELMLDYAKTRQQFGRVIGSFQAVKHHCANAALALEKARDTAACLARDLEDNKPIDRDLARHLAMATCLEASNRVIGLAQQVFGGIGFTWEHPLHFYLKRSLANRELFSATAVHRAFVAEELLTRG
jgi:alkylation response protein AidB-like acyl-CoA dehydrogenase